MSLRRETKDCEFTKLRVGFSTGIAQEIKCDAKVSVICGNEGKTIKQTFGLIQLYDTIGLSMIVIRIKNKEKKKSLIELVLPI